MAEMPGGGSRNVVEKGGMEMGTYVAPSVKMSLPGPNSVRLFKRGGELFLGASATDTGAFVARLKKDWFIEDVDGNVYLDWNTGWTAAPLGFGQEEVLAAAESAMRTYGHECIDSVLPEWAFVLAERLVEIAPPGLTRVYYDTTGSEVAENSVRIQREAAGPSRPWIITFFGNFHGGNYGTGAMGPHHPHYTHGVEEFVHGWINVPYPTCYRCPYHLSYPSCNMACLDYIEEMVLRYKAEPETIAGVIFEVIQGENGVQIPPPEWPGRLSALCRKYGWSLNNDEVQEGLGRTGKWFAIEHYEGAEADLLSLGKSLSGGLIPIAACLGTDAMSEAAGRLYLGGTFAGSPVGCAAAAKTIEIMQRDRVLDNVAELERVALEKLKPLVDRYEAVGDVRVKGAYMAVEFVRDKQSKEPDREFAAAVARELVQRGVVPIYEGEFPWIRPTPALNMPPELFARGCEIFEETVADLSRERGRGVA